MIRRSLCALVLLVLSAVHVLAVNPSEILDDPKLESRARAISAQLRCMVCQNQSIDVSNADLARDLRLLVRARLLQGVSDKDVMNYVVSRYGEFVRLKPHVTPKTWLLWGFPIVLLILAIMVLWRLAATRRASELALSVSEEAELKIILEKNNEN